MPVPHTSLAGWSFAWLLAVTLAAGSPAPVRAADTRDDGLRGVTVERFGIAVRVPQCWNLTNWARNATAFELMLPQEPNSACGYVRCELGIAPESLGELEKRLAEADKTETIPEAQRPRDTERRIVFDRQQPKRKLVSSRVLGEAGTDDKPGTERLVTTWEYTPARGAPWHEMRVCLVRSGHLYTFSINSDQAHYEAYRLDFEDMLAGAQYSAPETGLMRLAAGTWMQRDYRFALWLPAGWHPAFAPSDKLLFFATGETHAAADQMYVLAAPVEKLDLKALREKLPGELTQSDPSAKVLSCEIVPLGDVGALETVIETHRGGQDLTVVERRFVSQRRRYEVRYTVLRSRYEQQKEAIQKSLNSFHEVETKPGGVT